MSCSTRTKLLRMQSLAVLLVSAAMCATSASAQNNLPPPSGAILDLAGQTINHGPAVTESVDFKANLAATDITFAFRDDSYYISFSDVSLTDITTKSTTNLILNGDFGLGSGPTATDWTYANSYGATSGGGRSTSCNGGLSTCWFDGAVQAYDAIDQLVATNVGDTYQLSFLYSESSALSTFSALSTNGDVTNSGGNGVDILAYEQAGLPPSGTVTPEPDSIVLMSTGVLLLGAAFYYKRRDGMGEIS